ncbi:AraC family transcriptional regulator [Tepidibacter formicigenes]|jgi:AraC-like DNA-binding protein|uniref:Transcriptional regulator, AraC family n=1 Tax=Tepidibacter formicigenes DSM 15518 TaxID=1123349 RepID=A0A1M6TSK1_9FIRM|nr:AraC family transcriptional regulator [Tepidibacter formicigenes]SHK59982.1 transcriptional regulator, AraC family [Tepidibacter formicigenes DSM 15518]
MLNSFDRNLELLDGLETEYMRLLYYDFSQPYKGNYKSYESNRICTILNGEKKVKINEKEAFCYGKEEFVILPAYSQVHMEINIPTKALVLEIKEDVIKNITNKVSLDFQIDMKNRDERLFVGNKTNDVKLLIEKILNTYYSLEKNKSFLMDLYLQEMIYNVLKIKGADIILRKEDKHPIFLAINYMKENYDKNIKIKDIANGLNMSESNFSIYFKKITGITPKKYLKNIKLNKAIELLKENNVTEVAFDLGYENISYFISEFKNKYGYTPKQYQKNI